LVCHTRYMGAVFHPDHKEKKLHRCLMCYTAFESKSPICPTCGIIVTEQSNQTDPKTKGSLAPLILILIIVGVGYIIYYDLGLIQNIIKYEEDTNQLTISIPQRDASKIHEELRIGNSLFSFYEKIRNEYGSSFTSKDDQCKFSAQLALHDLARLSWTSIEEEYEENVGEESPEQAYIQLSKAYNYCEIDQTDSNTEKIEKILDFVSWYVEYEPEIDDSQRAPVETLSLRSGDCDDFTILVSALFEIAEIECAIGSFENEAGEGHAMVLVHLDELEGYRYWRYEDLTSLGLLEGDWIKIEPQAPLDEQADEEWMSQWIIKMAVEVDYKKATS
jgi:hypothetical protein